MAMTESDLRAIFRLDAGEAKQHARCGPRAACRVNALKDVDKTLDEYLELSRETQPA